MKILNECLYNRDSIEPVKDTGIHSMNFITRILYNNLAFIKSFIKSLMILSMILSMKVAQFTYHGSKDNYVPMEWMTSKLHGKEHGSDGQGLLGGARVCFLSKFSRLI